MMVASLSPFLPYAVLAIVSYLYGKDILAFLGSKISGVSVAQIKADSSTVGQAALHPISTVGDALKAATTHYISPEEQKKEIIKLASDMHLAAAKKINLPFPKPQNQAQYQSNINAMKTALAVPYPNPQTQAEFRANIAAIDKAKGFKK